MRSGTLVKPVFLFVVAMGAMGAMGADTVGPCALTVIDNSVLELTLRVRLECTMGYPDIEDFQVLKSTCLIFAQFRSESDNSYCLTNMAFFSNSPSM